MMPMIPVIEVLDDALLRSGIVVNKVRAAQLLVRGRRCRGSTWATGLWEFGVDYFKIFWVSNYNVENLGHNISGTREASQHNNEAVISQSCTNIADQSKTIFGGSPLLIFWFLLREEYCWKSWPGSKTMYVSKGTALIRWFLWTDNYLHIHPSDFASQAL